MGILRDSDAPLRVLVGFGFGAIQAGLFLAEAQASGQFRRLVVAYRRADVIAQVRANEGCIRVNVAQAEGIEVQEICGLEIYHIHEAADRQKIIAALIEADTITTALSSVADYDSGDEASISRLLAQAVAQRDGEHPAVVYAAENHTQAADILAQKVASYVAAALPLSQRMCFINTDIGKMSASLDEDAMKARNLMPITPDSQKAFLVEAFKEIHINQLPSGLALPFASFRPKADLQPFAEAKLYGHNAMHALAAYLALYRGLAFIKDVAADPQLYKLVREAGVEESGAALIRKYQGVDALFSPKGFSHFVDNLLERMVNPYLADTAARVGRDIPRKLGWHDRLIGAMRLALSQGVKPERYALGVAAALHQLGQVQGWRDYLLALWPEEADVTEQQAVLALIETGWLALAKFG